MEGIFLLVILSTQKVWIFKFGHRCARNGKLSLMMKRKLISEIHIMKLALRL